MSQTHPAEGKLESRASRATRVLLVEDHPLFRERLAMLINREPDMEVLGEAASEIEARDQIKITRPDVVILDLTLTEGSGVNLLRELHAGHPDIPVLVLSMHEEAIHAPRCLKLGARGYVMKTEAARQVLSAIRTVSAGGIYLSPRMRAEVRHQLERQAAIEAPNLDVLSAREREVFELLGRNLAIAAVAGALSLGEGTVDTYVQRIKRKLGLNSRAEVWRCARHWADAHPR